jgi:hypothetical protein
VPEDLRWDAPRPPFLVLIGLSIIGFWWLFFMPTYCDHLTNAGEPCLIRVYGKCNGCQWHSQLFTGIMLAATVGSLCTEPRGTKHHATTVSFGHGCS